MRAAPPSTAAHSNRRGAPPRDRSDNQPEGNTHNVDIIANAIVKANSTDKDKIIDVMHKSAVPGLLIPEYKFDEFGDVVNGPLYIYTIEKGQFKLVEQWKD